MSLHYADVCAKPDGRLVFCHDADGPSVVMRIEDAEITVSVPEAFLQLRCGWINGVIIVGKGHVSGHALVTADGGDVADLGESFGDNSVAVGPDGVYVCRSGSRVDVLTPAGVFVRRIDVAVGSQGIRDVTPEGELRTGDAWFSLTVEGMTLIQPCQRGAVTVGQTDPPQIAGDNGHAPFTAIKGEAYNPHVCQLPGDNYAICARTPAGPRLVVVPPYPPFVGQTPIPPQPPMTTITCALKEPGGYLNWRWGGGQSLTPPTHPADSNHAPFEHGRPHIGGDETCQLVPQGSTYAARSPNGRSWLSRQPDGSLQERPTSDPHQPGPWETGPYDATTGTWQPPHGPAYAVQPVGAPVPPDPPPGPSGGFLHVDGRRLVDDTGRDVLWAGYTMHTLIANVSKGEDIAPRLAEAKGYGYTAIVVIGCHLSEWKIAHGFACDPRAADHPTWQARLYDAAAEQGLRVGYMALADAQGLTSSEQQAIVRRAADVARGRWNALFVVGNEGGYGDQGGGANGWSSSSFERPADMGGVLCSRGSFGIDRPPDPQHWDVALWEPRRDPVHKAMDDAGAGVLELIAGYAEYPGVPNGTVTAVWEPPFFHDTSPDMFGDARWTDPKQALQLGLNIAANVPIGCFGASDGLVGRPLQPRAAECARQFARGLHAGFVR